MKVAIAAAAIVAIAALVVFLVRKVTKDPAAKSNERPAPYARFKDGVEERATQEIVPVADVRGPILLQKDGTCACYLRVELKNMSLYSPEELVADASSVAAALAGHTRGIIKILRIRRPADHAANLARLDACMADYDGRIQVEATSDDAGARRRAESLNARRKILARYRMHAEMESRRAGGSRADVYVCLYEPYGQGAEEAVWQAAADMRDRLKTAGYDAVPLWGEEIVAMGLAYEGDWRSANENRSPDALSPLVRGVNDGAEEAVAFGGDDEEREGDEEHGFEEACRKAS